MHEKSEQKHAYLVALQQGFQKDWEVEESLAELVDLAQDAGLDVVESFVQKRATLIQEPSSVRGKALELAEMLDEDSIVIFDELTPAQQGNLST